MGKCFMEQGNIFAAKLKTERMQIDKKSLGIDQEPRFAVNLGLKINQH